MSGAQCVGRHLGAARNLTNCEDSEAVATFEWANGRSLPRRVPPPAAAAAPAALAGRVHCGLHTPGQSSGGGRSSTRGSRTGPTVAAWHCRSPLPRDAFSHVVAYARLPQAGVGTADTLLDAAPTEFVGCCSTARVVRASDAALLGPRSPAGPRLAGDSVARHTARSESEAAAAVATAALYQAFPKRRTLTERK